MIVDFLGFVGHRDGHEMTAEALTAHMDAAGIDRTVFSNCDGASHGEMAPNVEEQDANVAALKIHQAHARLLPAYWVRAGRFDSNVHAFAGAMDAEPFAAAAFAPLLNDYDLDAEVLDPYLGVLARNHRPALFLMGNDDRTDPARLYRLGQRHPGVAIVFCCEARNTHMRDAVDVAERAVLRRDARLYWAAANATGADIADAVKRLGDDHVLFASPNSGETSHTEYARELLGELKGLLSPEAFRSVTGETARRLLRRSDAPCGVA